MTDSSKSLGYLIRVVVFLAAVVTASALYSGELMRLFTTNPPLNGLILVLLVLGTGDVLWHLIVLVREERFLDRLQEAIRHSQQGLRGPEEVEHRVLGERHSPLAGFLATLQQVVERGHHHATLPYLLDTLGERAEGRRALPRYLAATVVVLGLLGTFWGLIQTVQGVQAIIANISAEEHASVAEFVSALRARMADPIDGMALAFATSLFGLGASLILGFADNQLARAATRLHNRAEALVVMDLIPFWEARRAPEARTAGAAERPAYTAALLEGVSERLDTVAERMDRLLAERADPEHLRQEVEDLNTHLEQAIRGLGERLEGAQAEERRSLHETLDRMARVLAHVANGGGDAAS